MTHIINLKDNRLGEVLHLKMQEIQQQIVVKVQYYLQKLQKPKFQLKILQNHNYKKHQIAKKI